MCQPLGVGASVSVTEEELGLDRILVFIDRIVLIAKNLKLLGE